MKERPILFSAPMVRAILDGRKTQTRRIMKSQPYTLRVEGFGYPTKAGGFVSLQSEHCLNECPYGKPGDRLWVRETHYAYGYWTKHYCGEKGKDVWHFNDKTLPGKYRFERPADTLRRSAGAIGWFKRPAIFMPRAASRILLEITDVRVQRLQDISEEDARAEGVERLSDAPACLTPWKNYRLNPGAPFAMNHSIAAASFMSLWDSINGADAHKSNPWVWTISFRRIEAAERAA